MEEIQYKIESQIENIEMSIQTLAYYSGGKHPISFFLKMLYFQTGVWSGILWVVGAKMI